MDERYTIKGLTSIEGQHDVYNCHQPNCLTCKAFWKYATRLREQAEREEPRGRPSVKKWIEARYLEGMIVRKIAFNVDWPDDKVIKYLTSVKLYKKPKRPHRRVRPAPVQLELRIGDQSRTVAIPYRQAQLTKLVWTGYSVQAIAKKLNMKAPAVYQYIRSHEEIPDVQQRTLTFQNVTYNGDQHRYFDGNGNEYRIIKLKA